MSDSEAQLDRIFNELSALRKGQSVQGERLVRIETNLTNHIDGSVPIREKVDRHEQSLQRFKGIAWLLTILWTTLLTALGIKYGVK